MLPVVAGSAAKATLSSRSAALAILISSRKRAAFAATRDGIECPIEIKLEAGSSGNDMEAVLPWQAGGCDHAHL